MPCVLLVVCVSSAFVRGVRADAEGAAAADDADDADDDDDDIDSDIDGEFVPMPRRSIAIGFAGHGTRMAGRSESGFGPSLELALGVDRWQYFVEGGFATSGLNAWTTGVMEARVDGRMLRGGVGARWLARQFREGGGAIELFLASLVGLQRFYLDDATRLTRPEIAVGFGLQGRTLQRPRFGFRIDARVLFTPSDDEEERAAVVSCRGGGCASDGTSSTGFMGGVAVVW